MPADRIFFPLAPSKCMVDCTSLKHCAFESPRWLWMGTLFWIRGVDDYPGLLE